MKKSSVIILILSLFACHSQLLAQHLIGDIAGKWSITKYQSKVETEARSGTVEFLSDGTFVSEGIHFGVQKGLFRTDETRSLVIIETSSGTSEWNASIKDDVLRLRSVKGKGPKTYLTLMRQKPEAITSEKK